MDLNYLKFRPVSEFWNMGLCMLLQVRSLNTVLWFLLEKGLDYKQLVEWKNCCISYVKKF
jgi:hypothetical protein